MYRWRSGNSLASEGPYAETQEHLAGFFLVDCASRERAEEIAAQFAGPGSVAELRPAYVWECRALRPTCRDTGGWTIGSVNAPWWRLAAEREQTKECGTLVVDRTDDASDLLPPFYD